MINPTRLSCSRGWASLDETANMQKAIKTYSRGTEFMCYAAGSFGTYRWELIVSHGCSYLSSRSRLRVSTVESYTLYPGDGNDYMFPLIEYLRRFDPPKGVSYHD